MNIAIVGQYGKRLGNGKTILTLKYFLDDLFRNKKCVGISNIPIFNLPNRIMNRIYFEPLFIGIKNRIKENKKKAITILLDESQDYFDRQKWGSKAQQNNTYFLNLFRKFRCNMFFNVPSFNRLTRRVVEMVDDIQFPVLYKNDTLRIESILTNKVLKCNVKYYYNKYRTLHAHFETRDDTLQYILELALKNDEIVNLFVSYMSQEKNRKFYVTKSMLKQKLYLLYEVSKDEAELLFSQIISEISKNI